MSFATSISKVDLYHQCARRYMYEHILGLKQPQTIAMLVGEVYHDALSALANVKFHDIENEDSDKALEVIVMSSLLKYADKLWALKIDSKALEQELLPNLTRVYPFWSPSKLWPLEIAPNQALIERSFWGNSLGYNGKIDLASTNFPVVSTTGKVKDWQQDTPCVLDFKVLTGRRRKTERDTRLSGQLALYAAQTGIPRAAFLEIPRNLEKPVLVRTVEYDPRELGWWQKWLEQQSGHLRIMHEVADKWKASVGDTLEAFEKNPLALGMMHENFPMCQRSEPLCSAQWCPHYDRCYPYDSKSEEPSKPEE